MPPAAAFAATTGTGSPHDTQTGIWFAAGTMAVDFTHSSCAAPKLETPMDLTFLAVYSSENACHWPRMPSQPDDDG